jgi:ribosomal silencing factor RsfS
MTEVSDKKDVQKLQRTIVDSLEDVKAQDIQVFNTEHLSPLFERVVIACGTSNRQTKTVSPDFVGMSSSDVYMCSCRRHEKSRYQLDWQRIYL